MKKQVKNGVIKVLILVLILAGAYGLWCHFLTDNVIWKKLKINGIAIQGMTKEEAIDAISKDFQEKYENTQMTITLNGKNFKVSIYPCLLYTSRHGGQRLGSGGFCLRDRRCLRRSFLFWYCYYQPPSGKPGL